MYLMSAVESCCSFETGSSRFYTCLTVLPFYSLASTLKKMDPEHGEQILEYFQTHALLARDKACGSEFMSQ